MRTVLDIRLLPILTIAAASLLALKTLWFITGAGLMQGPQTVIAAAAPPAEGEAGDVAVTGSSAKPSPPKDAEAAKAGEAPKPNLSMPSPLKRPEVPVPTEPDHSALSAGEKALLQRLQERRQELEARARELDVREGLLKAAESRLDQRLQELKAIEARMATVRAEQDEAEKQRLKNLVIMYESMRAKDAARIFDRLDVKLLVEVVMKMNPRKVSDVMAQMSPETAERLTVEIANRKTAAPSELPKIEGRKS